MRTFASAQLPQLRRPALRLTLSAGSALCRTAARACEHADTVVSAPRSARQVRKNCSDTLTTHSPLRPRSRSTHLVRPRHAVHLAYVAARRAARARLGFMFNSAMTSPAAHAALWDVLRKEARPPRLRAQRLRRVSRSGAQARKLEGEVDSKLAAFSKLGGSPPRRCTLARRPPAEHGACVQAVTSLRRCSATAATRREQARCLCFRISLAC